MVAWASVFATFMVARKVYENWHWWLVIDSVSLCLYFTRRLYLTTLLFALYLALIVDRHARMAPQPADSRRMRPSELERSPSAMCPGRAHSRSSASGRVSSTTATVWRAATGCIHCVFRRRCAAELGIDREWECRVLERAEAAGSGTDRSSAASRAKAFWSRAGWPGGHGRPRKCARRTEHRMHRATRATHSRALPVPQGAAHDEPGRLDRPLSGRAGATGPRADRRPIGAAAARAPAIRCGRASWRSSPCRLRPRPCCATAICTRRTSYSARKVRSCSIGNTPTFRTRCGIWRDGPATTIFAPIPGDYCWRAIWAAADAPEDSARLEQLVWLYDYVCLLWCEVYAKLRPDVPGDGHIRPGAPAGAAPRREPAVVAPGKVPAH